MNLQEHLDVELTFHIFVNFSVEALLERDDVTEDEITEALQNHLNAGLKTKLAQAIHEKNTLESIVGKQADDMEVLFLAVMNVVIAGSQSADDFKSTCSQLAPAFIAINEKIESGEYKLVHRSKGLITADVIAESMQARYETAVIFEQLS